MPEKQTSNNELARMIKAGFDNTPTKEQFESLEQRVGSLELKMGTLEKDVKFIKENVEDARKLGQRVEYIENVLAIKK